MSVPISVLDVPPVAHAGRKITVLHLIHSVCHGGIESALINWVRFFDRVHFNVEVACFTGDRGREAAFLAAADRAGFPVHSVPWTKYKPFLKAARGVARLVKELNVDVVHTHAYYADIVGVMAKLFVPVKTVATVYVWGKYEMHRQIMQAMDWSALHFADKVTAHCDDTYRKTIRIGFRAERVGKLIAGFPAHEYTPLPANERLALRRDMGVRDDEILMLNVARIHPEKAHDQLLQSFRIVHDQYPNTRLWISGVGWPWLEEQLLAQRNQLGLDGSVDFVGFRENLWPLLTAADMMTHSSHVEGVPIAILYGMAAALPIVISDVGGVREAINHEQTGVLVPENDVDGFAAQIVRLIQDRELRARIGKAARQFTLTDYSVYTAVDRVAKTYREVLGR